MISIRDSVRESLRDSKWDSSRTDQSRTEQSTSAHSTPAQNSAERGAKLILDCYQELAGRQPSALDQQTAWEFATSTVSAEVIVGKMRARADRQGPGWRPGSLHYFRGMVRELEQAQPRNLSLGAGPNTEVGWCDACDNAGWLADRTHPVVTTYSKCPICKGNPPLDPDPPLQLWAKYGRGGSRC